MNRYLYRVRYDRTDQEPTYESVVVDAADAATAESEVEAATDRFRQLVKATRTVTLLSTTVGV